MSIFTLLDFLIGIVIVIHECVAVDQCFVYWVYNSVLRHFSLNIDRIYAGLRVLDLENLKALICLCLMPIKGIVDDAGR